MKKKIFGVFLFFLLIFLLFVLPETLIKISEIECSSQYGACPVELESRMEEALGKNLRQAKKTSSNILEDNFLVADFSLQLKLPDVLKVDVVVKKAVYAVRKIDTDSFALVDRDGFVVSLTNNSSLPQIVTNENPKNVGEMIPENQIIALKLMEGIYSMYQVNSGTINDSSLAVDLDSQVRVIFPLEGTQDNDILLGSLRLVYSQIQDGVEGKFYREIDLRFKNPVLR